MNREYLKKGWNEARIWGCFFFCMLTIFIYDYPVKLYAESVLQPTQIETGREDIVSSSSKYEFATDGNMLIPLEINGDGAVVMEMQVEKSGFINMEIHNKADGSDLPTYWTCQCTSDLRNTNTTRKFFEKGTYYIRFPENQYSIRLIYYSNASKRIKNDEYVAGYADYHHPVYYEFKSTENGYVTIQNNSIIKTDFSADVTMCDSKGDEITDTMRYHELDETIVYAVKKGKTYKFKVTSNDVGGTQFYQFHLKFTERKEASGDKRKKAVEVKYNKDASGLVFAEDSLKTADWYKITNSKKRKVKLSYSGSITSGSMVFDIYDSKGKKFASYSVVSRVGEKKQCLLVNTKDDLKLDKGTYYIRVTKSGKTASGIYTIRMSNY